MVTSTKHDRVDSNSFYSVYYLQTSQCPKSTALNSHENPIQYNSMQYASLLFHFPLVLIHQFLTCDNVLQKLARHSIKGKVPQLLIAQRQQDFQRKMRHPSVQNIHRSSTRHYYISQKFKLGGLLSRFSCNRSLFNTRLETDHKISSW
jgi:hypothetical protein